MRCEVFLFQSAKFQLVNHCNHSKGLSWGGSAFSLCMFLPDLLCYCTGTFLYQQQVSSGVVQPALLLGSRLSGYYTLVCVCGCPVLVLFFSYRMKSRKLWSSAPLRIWSLRKFRPDLCSLLRGFRCSAVTSTLHLGDLITRPSLGESSSQNPNPRSVRWPTAISAIWILLSVTPQENTCESIDWVGTPIGLAVRVPVG